LLLRLIWLLTATTGNSERTASFPGWRRTGMIAMMTKETAGMPAPGMFAR